MVDQCTVSSCVFYVRSLLGSMQSSSQDGEIKLQYCIIMGNKFLELLCVSNILRGQKPVTMVMATMVMATMAIAIKI